MKKISAIIYSVGVISFMSVFIGYMWLTTLHLYERVSFITFIPMIIPLIDLCAVPIAGYEIGISTPFVTKIIVSAIIGIAVIVSIIVGKKLAIDLYEDEDCDPSYASFIMICLYSFLTFGFAIASLFLPTEVGKFFT